MALVPLPHREVPEPNNEILIQSYKYIRGVYKIAKAEKEWLTARLKTRIKENGGNPLHTPVGTASIVKQHWRVYDPRILADMLPADVFLNIIKVTNELLDEWCFINGKDSRDYDGALREDIHDAINVT